MNKFKYFSIIFVFCLGLTLCLSFLGAQAQETTTDDLGASTLKIKSSPIGIPKISVNIPGLSLRETVCTDKECATPWLADYIIALYKYGIGVIGILAVITIMIGGIMWVTAGGNNERVSEAKKWIGGSIIGVLIALTSYLILNFVNPALVALSPLKLQYIENIALPEIPEMSEEEVQEEKQQEEVGELASDNKYSKRKTTEYIIVHTAAGILSAAEVNTGHIQRGFKGIGYNLYIERDGRLVNGRGEDAIGSHAIGFNTKSIGISYSGCAQKSPPINQSLSTAVSSGTITQGQLDILISTIKSLQQKYHIPRDKVLGHTETPNVSKACPCISMDELRAKLLP